MTLSTGDMLRITNGALKSFKNKYGFDYCHDDYCDMQQSALEAILRAPVGMPERYYFVVARRAALAYMLWWKTGITTDKLRSVDAPQFLTAIDQSAERIAAPTGGSPHRNLSRTEREILESTFLCGKKHSVGRTRRFVETKVEICEHILAGDTNLGIAQELGKSPEYVQKVRHVIRKELKRLITVTDFLVAGMNPPELENPPTVLPEGTRCALEGQAITAGYAVSEIVPDSAGEFLDMLRGGVDGYLSENAARAFRGTWNMGSWMIFEDGTGYHPLISREEALKQGRPCWSDLVRQVWAERRGTGVLCILTTDVKKRVWTKAGVGTLGDATPVYLHDPEQNVSRIVVVDWRAMLEVLDFVEALLAAGFNKPTIQRSLLSDLKTAQSIGLKQAIEWENRLVALRAQPEYQIAYVISQRKAK